MRSSRHPTSNSGTQRTPGALGSRRLGTQFETGCRGVHLTAPIRPCRHPDPVWGPTRAHTAYPRCPLGHPDSDWGPKRTLHLSKMSVGHPVLSRGAQNGPSPPHRKGGRKTRPPLMILFVPRGLRPTLSGPGATPRPEARRQLAGDLHAIAHHAIGGGSKNRGVRILVDGDHGLRAARSRHRCWIAPETPRLMRSLGETDTPVCPTWCQYSSQPDSTKGRVQPSLPPRASASR